jgi:uncharacterized protein YbjT (DUF2867 family)
MRRALVFGATGYTGGHVVNRLRAQGVETVAHVRPDSSSGDRWTEHFSALGATVRREAWRPSEIRSLIEEIEPSWIFALLGTTNKRRKRVVSAGGDGASETYEAVDRDLTLMALDGAVSLNERPLFIYLSSLGAREDARLPYLRVRGEVERRLVASELPHIIAQPGFITGPDRPESRPMEHWGATVSDGALRLLAGLGATSPRDKWSSISGGALARGLVDAAESADATTAATLVSQELRPATRD